MDQLVALKSFKSHRRFSSGKGYCDSRAGARILRAIFTRYGATFDAGKRYCYCRSRHLPVKALVCGCKQSYFQNCDFYRGFCAANLCQSFLLSPHHGVQWALGSSQPLCAQALEEPVTDPFTDLGRSLCLDPERLFEPGCISPIKLSLAEGKDNGFLYSSVNSRSISRFGLSYEVPIWPRGPGL